MTGKDQYRIEVRAELSTERLQALVFFYAPLISVEALYLYQYLFLKGNSEDFSELNELLMELNISADAFEKQCGRLNEYSLLKTYQRDDSYIFVLHSPLRTDEFIKDDIFVRNFILETSGEHFQKLISDRRFADPLSGYADVSKKLSVQKLDPWNSSQEAYLKKPAEKRYDFHTRFDVDYFLKDISLNLLPMRFRTNENLREMARLADLYNISYDKMRTYLPKVAKSSDEVFDLKKLRRFCMNAETSYEAVGEGEYDVPCVSFLMARQDGREVTEYDRLIIYKLANDYHLEYPVINVLLEHGLKNCDNHLYGNYLYPIAADLHRNDANTAEKALKLLNRGKDTDSEDRLPKYDASVNQKMSKEEEEELLKLMGKK